MKNTYYIFSQKRYIVILFTGLIISLLLFKPLFNIYSGLALFSLFLFISTFFLARHFATAQSLITITNDKLILEWIKNFSLKQEQNILMDFADLKEWTVDDYNDFFTYRFTKKNNIIIEVCLDKKNGSHNNDDFLDQLQDIIEQFNENNKTLTIGYGKTFYERPFAKIFAFIAAGLIIFGWTWYFMAYSMNLSKLILATMPLATHIIITIIHNRK